VPASFVRVDSCNLRCSFCDTKYSYNHEFTTMTFKEIVDMLKTFDNKVVVCTGGEPLLNKNNARLLPLLLSNEGFQVYIETNGSVKLYREEELLQGKRENIHYVVDIKTPASQMERFDCIEHNSCLLLDGDEIKCVVASKEDIEFCKNKISKIFNNIKDKKINIILSPVFGEIKLQDLAEYVMQMKSIMKDSCLTVKLGIQLHKLIWPHIEKGV